jgi:hypothetical protein
VTKAVKRSLPVVALLGASVYCAFTSVMVAKLSPYPAATSAHLEFYLLVAGFLIFLGLGIWQLIWLLRRHGSENLS